MAPESTAECTVCNCPVVDANIKSFSTGFTSPSINPIDFAYIFANFSALLANSPVVLGTLCGIVVLYIVLVVYVRRLDGFDVMKVTIWCPLIDGKNEGFFTAVIPVRWLLSNRWWLKRRLCCLPKCAMEWLVDRICYMIADPVVYWRKMFNGRSVNDEFCYQRRNSKYAIIDPGFVMVPHIWNDIH